MRYRLLILFIGLLGCTFHSKGALEVCESCEYTSIKDALENTTDGDTVLVHSGTYKEGHIIIDKSITFKGIDYPVIDGEYETEILTIQANDVTVEGIQFQNVGTSHTTDRAAIRVDRHDNCLIKDNKLFDTFFGIYLEKADSCIVRGNKIIGNAEEEATSGNAIHLWYSEQTLVENNLAQNHRDGIYFEFVESSTIRNNHSKGNLRYGLHFMFSNYDKYINNTFEDNGAGVAVMFSKKIHMKRNLFIRNWGASAYGLYLKEISDGVIKNNRFVNNTYGIYFEGTNRCEIEENDFKNNGWAIEMMGSCLNNKVKENNFVGNNFDVSTNTRSAGTNIYKHNYWDQYTGYDMDDDGYGDVAYRPVKVFSFITNQTPTALILLRSMFIDILNFAEQVYPVLTPGKLEDPEPLMKPVETL